MKKVWFIILILNSLAVFVFSQADIEVFLDNSRKLKSDGKFEEAIAEITKAIKIQPDNAALYLKRADLAFLIKKAEVIESDMLKAISLTPNDFQNQATAVRYLIDVGRCPTALSIINSSVVQNPANADAYYSRSGVKNCLEDFEGALEDNAKAISLDPLNDIYKAGRANLFARQKNTGKSIESYNELISSMELKLQTAKDSEEINKIKRDLSGTYISRSRIVAKQNNGEAAFSDLSRAIELFPAAHTYEFRAKAFVWQKQFEKAVADYSEAIKLFSNNSGLYLKRGDVYALMNRYQEALKDYEKASSESNGRMKEIAEEKILSTKQKIKEISNQPK